MGQRGAGVSEGQRQTRQVPADGQPGRDQRHLVAVFFQEKKPGTYHTRFGCGLSSYWLGSYQRDYTNWKEYGDNPTRVVDVVRQLTTAQRNSLYRMLGLMQSTDKRHKPPVYAEGFSFSIRAGTMSDTSRHLLSKYQNSNSPGTTSGALLLAWGWMGRQAGAGEGAPPYAGGNLNIFKLFANPTDCSSTCVLSRLPPKPKTSGTYPFI